MRKLFDRTLSAWSALHPTVAATLLGALAAVALSASGHAAWAARVDFSALLMRALLPFLLFAGALHVDVPGLRREGGFIALLSSAGVVIATLLVGYGLRWTTVGLGRDVPLPACLLFGALISPTDPVAVLAIFRRAKVPRALAITVGAESLFNDGFAVIMFLSILGAMDGARVSMAQAGLLFLRQTGGGLALGLAFAALAARAVDRLRALPARLGATAAAAFAVYAGGNVLGVSGPLASIVCGIGVGGRDLELKAAWTGIDGVLNVAVFALLGLCAAQIPWSRAAAALGLLAVALALAARAVSVGLSMLALCRWKRFMPGTFRALTWGGLRGAIPLALALSLPASPERSLLLVMTYVVGLFSLIVQGSTI